MSPPADFLALVAEVARARAAHEAAEEQRTKAVDHCRDAFLRLNEARDRLHKAVETMVDQSRVEPTATS